MSNLRLLAFLVLSPLTIAASILMLPSLADKEVVTKEFQKTGVRIFAARPESIPSVKAEIITADAREEILKQYFKQFDSPLTNYASLIVSESDRVGIDFRLLPAIARQESGLCKIIPTDSYNCWGWGITSVDSLGFNSYEEGIRVVATGLKNNYIDKGLKTPQEIMAVYTPQSNGSWAKGVNEFMKDLE